MLFAKGYFEMLNYPGFAYAALDKHQQREAIQ